MSLELHQSRVVLQVGDGTVRTLQRLLWRRRAGAPRELCSKPRQCCGAGSEFRMSSRHSSKVCGDM